MGGVFNDLLSLIPDGSWEYGKYSVEGIIGRGSSQQVVINSFGWLGSVVFSASNCFATLQILPQNRKLSPVTDVSPESLRLLQLSNPQGQGGGWLQLYQRFNFQSSFGSFFIVLAQEPLPYCFSTRVQISLPAASTQTSAFISASAVTIEITDKAQFFRSLSNLPFLKSQADANLVEALKSLVQELKRGKS